jgi:hypothetical protein
LGFDSAWWLYSPGLSLLSNQKNTCAGIHGGKQRKETERVGVVRLQEIQRAPVRQPRQPALRPLGLIIPSAATSSSSETMALPRTTPVSKGQRITFGNHGGTVTLLLRWGNPAHASKRRYGRDLVLVINSVLRKSRPCSKQRSRAMNLALVGFTSPGARAVTYWLTEVEGGLLAVGSSPTVEIRRLCTDSRE